MLTGASINPLLAAPNWICSKTGDAVNADLNEEGVHDGPTGRGSIGSSGFYKIILCVAYPPHMREEGEMKFSILNFSFKNSLSIISL